MHSHRGFDVACGAYLADDVRDKCEDESQNEDDKRQHSHAQNALGRIYQIPLQHL